MAKKRKPTYLSDENFDYSESEINSIKKTTSNRKVSYDLKATDIISIDDIKKSPITLTETQESVGKLIEKSNICSIVGQPGSSKTFTAIFTGLKMLAQGKVNKIILSKPIIESGDENIGMLPGDINEKTSLYLLSYMNVLECILDKELIEQLIKSKFIEFVQIAYLRGRTFKDSSFVILDESQNCRIKGLYLIATRISNCSKLVLVGDHLQSDLPPKDNKFLDFLSLLTGIKGYNHYEFEQTHNMRNEFIIELTKKYNEYMKLQTELEEDKLARKRILKG